MTRTTADARVAAVRRFNRFYTRRIGVLHEGWLHSRFSLAQVRILYELAQRDGLAAAELSRDLDLDPGYLSRLLRDLQRQRLVVKKRSAADRRRSLLRLTSSGRAAFAKLDAGASAEVAAMLEKLASPRQVALVSAMKEIEGLLGPAPPPDRAFVLRPPGAGDLGWVVHRHGALYSHEYGWDERFEALVAEIVAQYVRRHDPQRDRCWIAERDGEILGSVFLVAKSRTVARLRLLLVEPRGRGLGIGTRLVDECVRFARQAGYRKVTLWTHPQLHAARRIYVRAGFRLVREEPHDLFGRGLVGQTWDLAL